MGARRYPKPTMYGVDELRGMPPEQIQAIRDAWTNYQMEEAQLQQEIQAEASKPPSQGEQIMSGLAAPVGTIAGLGAANYFFNGGSAASAAPAAQVAGQAANTGLQLTNATQAANTAGQGAQVFGHGAGMAQGANTTANVANATNAANSTAGTVGGGQGMLSGGYMGIAAPLAVGAIGAYTAQTALNAMERGRNKGIKGGFKEGMRAAGPLNYVPVLGQAAWAAGALAGAFGGKKDKDQYARDAVRSNLRDTGNITVEDGKWVLTRPDGSKYDIGADGSVRNYNIANPEDKATQDALSYANPLAEIFTGGKDDKLRSDFAGYLTNYAQGGGDVGANLRHQAELAGLDHDSARARLDAMRGEGFFDDATANIYGNAIDRLYQNQPAQKKDPAKQIAKTLAVGGKSSTPMTAGFGSGFGANGGFLPTTDVNAALANAKPARMPGKAPSKEMLGALKPVSGAGASMGPATPMARPETAQLPTGPRSPNVPVERFGMFGMAQDKLADSGLPFARKIARLMADGQRRRAMSQPL